MTSEMHPQRWGDPDAAEPLPDSVRGLVALAFGPLREPPLVPGRPAPSSLDEPLLDGLCAVVGADHVLADPATRALRTRGKYTPDLLRARAGDLADAPDVVVRPADQGQVEALLG